VVTASLGIFALSVAIVGWFLVPTSMPERLLFGAASLLLIKPGAMTDLSGIALLALLGAAAWARRRRTLAT
jgi:TRAP-type uncharacterized transport system fused permease subunit